MERKVVNPWSWQDQFGFVQANKVSGSEQLVLCAGQLSVDAHGRPLHPGDMAAQIGQALDNVEAVVHAAGLQPSNIVRLNYYTTDIDAFFGALASLSERLGAWQCQPASTLLGVVRLAIPECMIEIEATVSG
jgi:enamine deaminase RidA (YjgF/YER057c/UK114 family)